MPLDGRIIRLSLVAVRVDRVLIFAQPPVGVAAVRVNALIDQATA